MCVCHNLPTPLHLIKLSIPLPLDEDSESLLILGDSKNQNDLCNNKVVLLYPRGQNLVCHAGCINLLTVSDPRPKRRRGQISPNPQRFHRR
ncbi:MAG: hypothetical protein [Circoviridae sp.]|nr:MAG: hypothetical protein [Circoviridae sp.]